MNEAQKIQSAEAIQQAIVELGGDDLTLNSDIIELPFLCHDQAARLYHDNTHRENVARPAEARVIQRFGGDEFAATTNALKCLIGTYHDVVQINVDGGYLPNVMKVVDPYIIENDGVYSIKEDLSSVNSKRIWVLLDLFGFETGQELSVYVTPQNPGGMNEFLSAMVAMEELHCAGLPLKNIVRVVFGIAATIPFRGQVFFDNLVYRLETTNVGLTPEEVKLAALVAVETANCDVGDFKQADFISFIKGTWRLLPEYSAGLRDEHFPVQDYRKALCGTMIFLRDQVRPTQIFNYCYGYPSKAEVSDMGRKAKKNIATGVLYIQAKLASVGVLEAVGALAAPEESLRHLMKGLHRFSYVLPSTEYDDISQAVFSTLIDREDDVPFDSSQSPIAEYMFVYLTQEQIIRLSELVEHLFGGYDHEPRYRAYLKEVRDMMGEEHFDFIINELAYVAGTVVENHKRSQRIRSIPMILDAVS